MLLVEWGYFIKLHHIKDMVFFFMPSYSHFLCESPKTLSWGKDFPFIVYIMLQNARNKEGFSECVLHGRLCKVNIDNFLLTRSMHVLY